MPNKWDGSFLHKNKYTIDEVVQYITKKDDVSHMTIERKTALLMAYLVVTLEELKRVKGPQKPLTLDDVLSLDSIGDAWWVEYKDGNLVPTILTNDCHQYGEQILDGYTFKLFDYGKTWRCWISKPTDEERAAAPWEV